MNLFYAYHLKIFIAHKLIHLDIANIGSVPVGAGASTAIALIVFIKIISKIGYIDCSATYRKSGSDLWAVGATGIGVQTLKQI